MRRREFIALVGGEAITWPHAPVGQQNSAGLPRIGKLTAYLEGDTAQPVKPQPLAVALALLFADIWSGFRIFWGYKQVAWAIHRIRLAMDVFTASAQPWDHMYREVQKTTKGP